MIPVVRNRQAQLVELCAPAQQVFKFFSIQAPFEGNLFQSVMAVFYVGSLVTIDPVTFLHAVDGAFANIFMLIPTDHVVE